MTQWTKFAEGYQAALVDVLHAWQDGGEYAARMWIESNLKAGTNEQVTQRFT